jgi:hypothetical protein
MTHWKAIALFAVAGPLFAISPIVLGLFLSAVRDPVALGVGLVFAATAVAIGAVPAALAGVIFVGRWFLGRFTQQSQHPLRVMAYGMAAGFIVCLPLQLLAVWLPQGVGKPSTAGIATLMFLVPGTLAGGGCALLWRHITLNTWPSGLATHSFRLPWPWPCSWGLAFAGLLMPRLTSMQPNPSLHPTCNSRLRRLSPAGELQR